MLLAEIKTGAFSENLEAFSEKLEAFSEKPEAFSNKLKALSEGLNAQVKAKHMIFVASDSKQGHWRKRKHSQNTRLNCWISNK